MKLRRILTALITVSLLAAQSALAGEWHVGESLTCGQCHLEHSSAGGQPIPGGPYSVLLLNGTINELCLSCHDGSDPSAPDVLMPVSMYSQGVIAESGAGPFAVVGTSHPFGHDLGIASPIPLSNAGKSISMTCGTCHDYHGNSNYRNLRFDPAGVGDSIVIEAGRDLFWNVAPSNPPSTSGSALAYNRGNIGYATSWSHWCGSCHDQVAANSAAVLPAHFNAHPTDVSFGGVIGAGHVATSHWVSGSGEGFLGSSPITGEGIPRLPFLQPQATDFATSQQVQSTNLVFCGSCHAAHGTVNTMDLRWPYVDGGVNYLSGCQQCHHK
ncbi:MAG: hypothetical protein NTW07_13230 [candidate division Zixibacteria bacterium]|nr:hypothetical protein [candidate division Zixibacteria bacterium]